MLIYDPLLKKAYCKDFIVNLNLREDIYPEFPVIEGMKLQRGIKNVFEPWIEETSFVKQKIFDIDQEHTKQFSINHLTKD